MIDEPKKTPKPRGFATMTREQVKAIASKGGKAAQALGTAHQFTREEARAAGVKGGLAPHVRRGGPRATARETIDVRCGGCGVVETRRVASSLSVTKALGALDCTSCGAKGGFSIAEPPAENAPEAPPNPAEI